MTNHFQVIQQIALAYPEATEEPHFEKTSFRVHKKIFASWDAKKGRACLKLSLEDQDVFVAIGQGAIYPVPNKWGKQGWTFIEPDHLREELLQDALTCAYCEVAPERLARQLKP